MFKLFVFAAVLACAFAAPKPGVLSPLAYSSPIAYSNDWNSWNAWNSPLAYSGHIGAAPIAYSAQVAAPLAYSAQVAAPLAYSAQVAAPIAYSAPVAAAIPAPITYSTGVKVNYAAEPVEQHGYKIVY